MSSPPMNTDGLRIARLRRAGGQSLCHSERACSAPRRITSLSGGSMNPCERAEFRKKLESDLKTAGDEVIRLFAQRRVFEGLAKVFQESPAVNVEWTQLHTFLFAGYVAQACLRLRRLMDHDRRNDPVSLASIVWRVCKHPDILTRAEYVSRFTSGLKVRGARCQVPQVAGLALQAVSEHMECEANELFDRFTGPGQPCLDPARLCKACLPARWNCAKVLAYVDKRLAHYDRKRPEDPTWGELDEAIDAAGDLYCDLSVLIVGSAPKRDELAGTWQGAAWEPLLEVPWVTRVE